MRLKLLSFAVALLLCSGTRVSTAEMIKANDLAGFVKKGVADGSLVAIPPKMDGTNIVRDDSALADGRNFMDVNEVYRVYAKLTGKTVVRSGKAELGPISLQVGPGFRGNDAVRALDTALALDSVMMVSVGEDWILQTQSLGCSGFRTTTDSSMVTRIIKVPDKNLQELVRLLVPVATPGLQAIVTIPDQQTLVLRDSPENVKRMVDLIEASKAKLQSLLADKPTAQPVKP
jgi:hypothetical protein